MHPLVKNAPGAVAVALAIAACGSPPRTVDTKTALAVFQSSGYTNLRVFYGRRSAAELARRTGRPSIARDVVDTDWIYTTGYTPLEMPLSAVRFASVAVAERRYADDRPLLHGTLRPEDRSAVPPGFEADRLAEVRVCNVVVSSYNRDRARSVTRRFDRAVALLRARC
jgi:hypothetical protein